MAGETRTAAASAARNFYDNPGAGSFVVAMPLTFGATDNELNDIVQAGYLPPNTVVAGVSWFPTDMDTNGSPLVVHKVTLVKPDATTVDLVTGLTGAQTGASSYTPVIATAYPGNVATAPQLVQVQTTAAAATAAVGTATLVLHCQKA